MARFDWLKVSLVLAASSGAACHWLVSVKVDPIAAPIDASQVGDDAGPGFVDPCGPVVPPPTSPAAGNDGAPERSILFAVYKLPVAPVDDPELCAQTSFDLDGQDTQSGDGKCLGLVCQPHRTTTVPVTQCDGPEGRDDSLHTAFERARSLPNGAQALASFEIQPYIARGLTNVLIQVSAYNGGDDDEDVLVSFFSSAGVEGMAPGSATVAQAEDLPVIWDGGQDFAWTVDENSIRRQAGAQILLPHMVAPGYVRGGVLVVPHTGVGFFPTAPLRTRISDGTFMGRITREGERFKLVKARLGGRLSSEDILGILGSILYRGRAICEADQAETYSLLRGYICANVDLPADSGSPDPNASCGEISFGASLAAVESRFATEDAGDGIARVVVQGSAFLVKEPCADGGTRFCDGCEQAGPSRCPATLDAGTD